MAENPQYVEARTTFTEIDVMDVTGSEDRQACREWLARNGKYVVEAMARAGFDAIDTLLTEDPIIPPTHLTD